MRSINKTFEFQINNIYLYLGSAKFHPEQYHNYKSFSKLKTIHNII